MANLHLKEELNQVEFKLNLKKGLAIDCHRRVAQTYKKESFFEYADVTDSMNNDMK